jgi:hypothetical protein
VSILPGERIGRAAAIRLSEFTGVCIEEKHRKCRSGEIPFRQELAGPREDGQDKFVFPVGKAKREGATKQENQYNPLIQPKP